MVRRVIFATYVVLLLGVFWGCRKQQQQKSSNSVQKVDPNNIAPTVRNFSVAEGDPESIDPNLIAEGSGTNIGQQMFETLLLFSADNGKPEPGQATHWEISDDGTVYTFHLRKTATWSDGKPVTSRDYVFSWERALNPKTKSRNAEHYWLVKGAKAYNKGDVADFSTVGIEAVDTHTIRITLNAPAPYFLDLLTYVVFAPVPAHVVQAHGKAWARPDNIEVNGPFKLVEQKHRERIILEKNPRYWDASNVWLDRVSFFLTDREHTAFEWYERGKVMWTPGVVPLEKTAELRRSGRPDFRIDPYLCVYYYALNVQKPPLNDVRVRRAFNMSVDKGRLVRQVLGQGQKPATHLIPPLFGELRNYMGADGDPFDPERARQLLSEAGYGPGGKRFPELTIVYNTYESHRLIAEFIQRSLNTNLGVKLNINNMEWRSLLPKLHAGEFQIGRSGWCADFPDPQDFLQVFVSGGANNYSNYNNAEFDQIIDELRGTVDQKRRNLLSARAETLINKDVPILPLYFYVRTQMLRPYVKGMSPPQIQGRYLYKRIYFGAESK